MKRGTWLSRLQENEDNERYLIFKVVTFITRSLQLYKLAVEMQNKEGPENKGEKEMSFKLRSFK